MQGVVVFFGQYFNDLYYSRKRKRIPFAGLHKMTPEVFIDKWRKNTRTEKSAAQEHFLDICELLGVEKPGDVDPDGDWFTFEKHIAIDADKKGFVDVWRRNCFAWEYKRQYESGEFNHKNLVKAFAQVREYAGPLGNPPLLIVSDMKEIRIRTNFTNSISEQHVFQLADLNDPTVRQLLNRCFTNPETLRPEITREGVTTKAAMALGVIADKLRKKKYEPRRIAHFLNKIVFCMFAEDIDLLPNEVFADILEESQKSPEDFSALLHDLFRAMREKDGRFGMIKIPWFNGGLFDDDDVLPVGYFEIRDLATIARLDWSAIEPAIFGTLFESSLNPDKRQEMANLFDSYGVPEDKPNTLPGILDNPISDKGVGIHYTDPDTMMKIISPVVLIPLEMEWEETKSKIIKIRDKKAKAKSDSARTKFENQAREIYDQFRTRLANFRVLDPACGSGNFLYLSLQVLKDFDLRVIREALELELPRKDQCVGPDSMLGIEINPYAAELARVTIWIGELQWQMKNAYGINRSPILGSLDSIRNQDALINPDGTEAKWPITNAIVGNPPFLGANKFKRLLGEEYTDKLRAAFDNKVKKTSDLVLYWFQKASHISKNTGAKIGLVATSAIRTGNNLSDLKDFTKNQQLFNAWSDLPWVNEGANVRVSLICFHHEANSKITTVLNGDTVSAINPDLSDGSGADLSSAYPLSENSGFIYQGSKKVGPFEIDGQLAREWLKLPTNPNGKKNKDVLKLSWLTSDFMQRPRDKWIVDFGVSTPLDAAALYERPFEYVKNNVYPNRIKNPRKSRKEKWWLHGDPQPKMRKAISNLSRYIVTPEVTTIRVFVWAHAPILPDCKLMVIARDDDFVFGVLSSRFHQIWAYNKGGVRGQSRTYTPATTFETFPFPDGLNLKVPQAALIKNSHAKSIIEAAKELNNLREHWLNPPELVKREPEVVPGYPDRILPVGAKAEAELKKRTLTNLYKQRPAWLDNAHKKLDEAVSAAYGWPADISDEQAIENLLELNQERTLPEQ